MVPQGVLVLGLRSGKLGIKGGNFDRTQNPGLFWFSAFFILVVSLFLAIYGIAELSGVFHTQVTLLGEGLKRTAYEQGAKSVELWPKDQMQGVLALADRVIEMSKVMVQCNPPTTIQSELTLESPTIRRLQDCG